MIQVEEMAAYVRGRLSSVRELTRILEQTPETSTNRDGDPILIPWEFMDRYPGSSNKCDDIAHYLGVLRNKAEEGGRTFVAELEGRGGEAIRNIVFAYGHEPFRVGPAAVGGVGVYEKYGGEHALDAITALNDGGWSDAESELQTVLDTLTWR